MAVLAAMAPAMQTIGALGTLAGGAVSAIGQIKAARAEKEGLEFQAKQLEMRGKEEQAAAFQEAEEHRRRKEYALSRQQALAAASGFDPTDPSTLGLAEDIEKHGTLQQMMAMYGGKSRRAGFETQAAGRRATGKAVMAGAYPKAFGSILGGVTGMAKYYG